MIFLPLIINVIFMNHNFLHIYVYNLVGKFWSTRAHSIFLGQINEHIQYFIAP